MGITYDNNLTKHIKKGHLSIKTIKTYNKHGTKIFSISSAFIKNNFKKNIFDWRSRAILAINMLLKLNNLYLSSEYITKQTLEINISLNIIRKFIVVSDLRTKILGYIYGINMKEILLILQNIYFSIKKLTHRTCNSFTSTMGI